MTPDTITVDKAWELDAQWENAGRPGDMLHCVTYRKAGNGSKTLLTIPGDDMAPTYQAVNSHYEHVSGPTLAQWQAQHDVETLEGVLQAEYRDAHETERDLRASMHW